MLSFFTAAFYAKRGLFRVLAVLLLVFIGVLIGQVPYAYLTAGAYELSNNYTLVLLVLPFATGLGVLFVAVRWIHQQSGWTLIGPAASLDWRRMTFSFSVWFALITCCELILFLVYPEDYVWNFDYRTWLPLLFIAVFWLPFQTSFEEILFRGYLMQQIGISTNNRWVALWLTSLLFGAMHLANPEVVAFGLGTMMTYYICVGLLLGLCTLFDQRLEIALGIHAATNIYGATMVTFKESALQTPAMFRLLQMDAGLMTVLFLLSAVLFFAYFARHYRWKLSLHPVNTRPLADDGEPVEKRVV